MNSTRALRTGGVAALGDDQMDREFGWSRIVHGKHGTFLANPRDVYLGRALVKYGEYSDGEFELFRRVLKQGDVVVEVGANIGALTIPLARLAGPQGLVVAVEPQRVAFMTLAANVVLNGLLNVRPVHAGAGSERGVIKVPILDPHREQNFGGLDLKGGHPGGEDTPLMTLDEFGLGRLDFLKADVEGAEVEVLRGGIGTIQRCQPMLYVEADREAQTPELMEILRLIKYRAWWHFPRLFNPANHFGSAVNEYGNTVSINLFAVPAGKAEIAERLLPGAEALEGEAWPAAYERILGAQR